MPKMLDFKAVISTYGDAAAKYYCTFMDKDDKALDALASSDADGICDWLTYYSVFQGFTSKQRNDISEAIVKWAEGRPTERDLSSARLLDQAHKEMTGVCVGALGRQRGFTSLASKALWLCYPQHVPIFDSLACRALSVLSRLEEKIEPVPEGLSEYGELAHTWKLFFDTYADSITTIDMQACRYPVRVLDAVLLAIGEPA